MNKCCLVEMSFVLTFFFQRPDSIEFSSYFWQDKGWLNAQIVAVNELCSISQVLDAVLAFSQSV